MIISQEIEEKQILINDLEINYKISGKGQPVLILHGWGGSSDSWVQVQKILAEKELKIIVPDFPGFGKSRTPSKAWNVDSYVEWINGFIAEISKAYGEPIEPFFLLGHSFGGRISIKFAAKYPGEIKALILCSSAGIKPKGEINKKIFYYLARIGDYLFSLKPLLRFKDGARNKFYTLIRKKDYLKAEGVMRETIKNVLDEDLSDFLPKIKNKTLIVWGKLDRMVPIKYAYIMKEKIPNSQLIVLPKAGHSPQLDLPEKLAEIINQFIET